MERKGLNPLFKDSVEIFAWVIGIAGALIAAFIGINQLEENRQQRVEDLRWRQASTANELLDKMYSDNAKNATLMLDSGSRGREFKITDSYKERVTMNDVNISLDINKTKLSKKDQYIRDCFDDFFYAVDQIKRALDMKVIKIEDVSSSLMYQAERMRDSKEIFEKYMKTYKYDKALECFNILEVWK